MIAVEPSFCCICRFRRRADRDLRHRDRGHGEPFRALSLRDRVHQRRRHRSERRHRQDAKITIEAGDHPLVAHGILVEFSAGELTAARDYVYRCVLAPKVALLELSRQKSRLRRGRGNPPQGPRRQRSHNKGGRELRRPAATASTSATSCACAGNIPSASRSSNMARATSPSCAATASTTACSSSSSTAKTTRRSCSATRTTPSRRSRSAEATPSSQRQAWRRPRRRSRHDALCAVAKPSPAPSSCAITTKPVVAAPQVSETSRSTVSARSWNTPPFRGRGRGQGARQDPREEIACRRTLYVGTCNAPQLRAGTVFTLADHPLTAFSDRFLVVSATHSAAVQPPPPFRAAAVRGREPHRAALYERRHLHQARDAVPTRAQDAEAERRAGSSPPRSMPSRSRQARWMDDRGRYKVRFAFDDGEYQAARRATSSARASLSRPNATGMHFPSSRAGGRRRLPQRRSDGRSWSAPSPTRRTTIPSPRTTHPQPPRHRRQRDDGDRRPRGAPRRVGGGAAGPKDAPYFRIDTPAEVSGRSFTGTYLAHGQGDREGGARPPSRATKQKVAAAARQAQGGSRRRARRHAVDGRTALSTNKELNVNVVAARRTPTERDIRPRP